MSESEKECIISIKTSDDEANTRLEDKSIEVNDTSELAEDSGTVPNPDESIAESQSGSVKRNGETAEISDSPEVSQDQDVDPIDLYRKLEIIKEIKTKTIYLQRIKARISQEVVCIETETKSVQEFKNELDLLIQEEKAHLEELRQIQNDITMMENTIKQTNEEKLKALESAKRLHQEYKPLKEQVNHLRDSIGLDKTDENEDEILIEAFIRKLSPITEIKSKNSQSGQKSKSNENSNRSRKNSQSKKTSEYTNNKKDNLFMPHINNTSAKSFHTSHTANELPVQLATAALMAHSLRSLSPTSFNQQQQFQQQFNPFILNQVNMNNEKFKSLNNNNNNNHHLNNINTNVGKTEANKVQQNSQQTQQPLQSLPPPFRQQPPPMKTCLSCNQQIHRNAPICPLCKAKSRSSNPKKPKKKQSDTSPNTLKPAVSSKND